MSADEAKAASAAATSAVTTATAAAKGRGGRVSVRNVPPSPAAAPSIDVPALAALLLDESSPFVSASHRQLSQRALLALLRSLLTDPKSLGRSSLQADLRQWAANKNSNNMIRPRSPAPLSYAQQQALVMRVTEKRMILGIMAHIVAE